MVESTSSETFNSRIHSDKIKIMEVSESLVVSIKKFLTTRLSASLEGLNRSPCLAGGCRVMIKHASGTNVAPYIMQNCHVGDST